MVAELSGVALAVENQRRAFIGGQVALELVKLAVGDADGARDVPLVVLGTFGARIYDNHAGVAVNFLFDVTGFNGVVVAGRFLPHRESVSENLYIFITKFFRLPGGFVAQLSGGALAVENQQGGLVGGQLVCHFSKLAVGDAHGCGNITLVKLGPFGT